MKAFTLTANGPALVEAKRPTPRPHELVVRVRAAALNRADLAMAAGHHHGAAGGVGQVLGMEWAGEVVETGPDVSGFAAGDAVMGSGAGAFAEFTLADPSRISPIPAGMSFEDAACLPVGLQTMHDAVVTHGLLEPGQSVLIQGASSGVGLIAQQIAQIMGAGLVIGSSTNAERRARLTDYGAHLAIDSSDPGWVEQVLAATEGRGVDLIVDQVSGPTANQNLAATRILGRIVNVGRLGGMRGDFDFDRHALRRITYVGVTFRTRSAGEVREIVAAMQRDLWDSVSGGAIRVPIDRVFPLEAAADALEHMRANRHFGKIILGVA